MKIIIEIQTLPTGTGVKTTSEGQPQNEAEMLLAHTIARGIRVSLKTADQIMREAACGMEPMKSFDGEAADRAERFYKEGVPMNAPLKKECE